MAINKREAYKAGILLHRALHADDIRVRNSARKALREAITTSDLPVNLGPTMNKIMQGEYEQVPSNWREWADTLETPDFETVPYFSFDFTDDNVPVRKDGKGYVAQGLPAVGELGEYPILGLKAEQFKLKLAKAGVQIPLSWETLKRYGADWQLIPRITKELGRRAANQESIEAALQLVQPTGLNTTNFKAANKNVLAGNPELSIEALEKAFAQLAVTKYNGKRIIMPTKFNLIVPPALASRAEQIMKVVEIRRQNGTETQVMGNTVSGKVANVYEVPELALIAGDYADKCWFLLPPKGTMPRKNIVNVFLEGETGPKIFVEKTTNSSELDGSFENDAYRTKIRHLVKSAFIAPEGTLASSGAGA